LLFFLEKTSRFNNAPIAITAVDIRRFLVKKEKPDVRMCILSPEFFAEFF
jgi:hypothetical protein